MLKSVFKEPIIELDNEQLEKVIHESVKKLLTDNWLSDFLVEYNKRPILISSQFTNHTTASVDIQKLYDLIDMDLIESGEVRIVKSNEQQRNSSPLKLASGKSVDFVVSASIGTKNESTPSILIFQLSLWNNKSTTPVISIIKEIN